MTNSSFSDSEKRSDDVSSRQFTNDLCSLSRLALTEDARHQAKRCLLDYLGVTLAGAKMLDVQGRTMLEQLGTAEEATAIGFNRKAAVLSAALVNGLSAHKAELDDGVRFGSVHPGAPVLSAVLPMVESRNLSSECLLKGIVVGYEATVRLAMTIQPAHRNKGYHATGTCGTIGAAMGVAAALSFSTDKFHHAFAAAATSAAGMLKMMHDGSELKPFNAAQAASSGIIAALMSESGFHGPDEVLGGKWGFLEMVTDQVRVNHLKFDEIIPTAIHMTYIKPYAACRHCHAPIEAVLKLRTEHDVSVDEINSISVSTYSLATHGHDHCRIENVNSAKMSTPFSVAVALLYGDAGLSRFTKETITSPLVSALTNKVKVHMDNDLNKLVPDKRPAVVVIHLNNGTQLSARIDLPKGEPETPLSDEELTEKFSQLAAYGGKSQRDIARIVDVVWDIDNQYKELFHLLR